jgi:HSP20 family protein
MNKDSSDEKREIKITEEKLESDGKLTVDVYQTDSDLIIQSAVAGVDLENLDISIDKDLIIIKGKRERPEREKRDYFYKECYWGSFSRKIILPVKVQKDEIKATLRKGILTIKLPKKEGGEKKKIVVEE